ncbi:hypothetical protein PLAN_40107 [Planktothrix rubescens CCAP 1459/22]|uniref:Uncharacterized protein n=1 Tax=Planktothrix rubescens CCAP 1459/22 TaxID=329571 RepID=A0A6J7ZMJ1_PLARU|nr:hypothetical protein PLAN_40107 [Planktothrix rubescens NIVA-CYA 18]CAD0225410.1 hypothetical protein PL10110_240060 [Planktothrix agardhii]
MLFLTKIKGVLLIKSGAKYYLKNQVFFALIAIWVLLRQINTA